MNMEQKRLIPSNDAIQSDSFDGLYVEKAENNVSDQEFSSVISTQETTTQSFPWSLPVK